MHRPVCVLAATATAICAAAVLAQSPVPARALIDTDRVTGHVKVLASDEFEGRAPGSRAEVKTVEYLIRQLAAAGVLPGGGPDSTLVAQDFSPDIRRGWTQDVPLAVSEIVGEVSAKIETGTSSIPLRQGGDIALRASHLPGNRVSIQAAPLVFIGYGVSAPELGWDDFKGADLTGKIGVVLINDPDFEADLKGLFGGLAMTYYGRWTYKFEEAARRGAAGILVIHESAPAAYGWATVRSSNTSSMFDIVRPNPAAVHPPVEAWIQREVALRLFREAGLDFDSEKKKAQSAAFRPVPLGNARLSLAYDVRQSTIVSKNVIGCLPGRTRPTETIIYTAHWDHLGIGEADARGDRIYNGARDNAIGVAGLLELARAFAAAPRTDRSVVFLALTAEEKGLLGSEYYAQHPVYPLEKTVAVLNMDGGSIAGPTRDVAIAGDGKVTLQMDLANAAARQGRRFSPDPQPQAGSFFRSDHFPFAKVGVPAISFRVGLDRVDGGTAAGRAESDAYTAKQYHQPADEWSSTWDLRGFAMDIDLLYSLGRALAQSSTWPAWLPGSEFKQVRDRSASARE
jgi:Zn-dependent M28 family amino/carboxypeptidase